MKKGHGGNLRKLAESAGVAPSEILDFSASINPLGPPEWLRDEISSAVSSLVHYPDTECEELVEAIVRRTKGASPAFIKELMRRAAQFQFETGGDAKLDQPAIDGAIEEMVFPGGALNLKLLGGSSAELSLTGEAPLRSLA